MVIYYCHNEEYIITLCSLFFLNDGSFNQQISLKWNAFLQHSIVFCLLAECSVEVFLGPKSHLKSILTQTHIIFIKEKTESDPGLEMHCSTGCK